jgi:hypothetical protein
MKNTLLTILLYATILATTAIRIQAQSIFTQQRVIIIMMDGFAEKYYRNAAMPFLNQMEKEGTPDAVTFRKSTQP